MKTELMKLKKQSMRRAQEERRVQARLADLKKLRRAVWLGSHRIIAFFAAWFGIQVFDWSRRYSNKYVCDWARQENWRSSRLTTAVAMVDRAMRLRKNRVARVKDAIRRRARNIMKWNRKQKGKK